MAPSRHDWKRLTGTFNLNTNKQSKWLMGSMERMSIKSGKITRFGDNKSQLFKLLSLFTPCSQIIFLLPLQIHKIIQTVTTKLCSYEVAYDINFSCYGSAQSVTECSLSS